MNEPEAMPNVYAISRPAEVGDTVRTPTNNLATVVEVERDDLGEYATVVVEQYDIGSGKHYRGRWTRRQLINFGR